MPSSFMAQVSWGSPDDSGLGSVLRVNMACRSV